MGILGMLMGGFKALVKTTLTAVKDIVVATVRELEDTITGRAAATAFETWVQKKSKAHSHAADLAEEEAELAQKKAKDGKLSPSDLDRLNEIGKEKDDIREAHAQADAARMKEDLQDENAKVVKVEDDELLSGVGLLTHKICQCGGRMAVTSKHRSVNGGAYRTEYEWTCPACQKREKFDPLKKAASLVRRPDADLDLSTETRHRLWNEPKTLAETNARLSSHLGESDKDVLCPNHLIPMKLFPSLTASKGLVLDSYAYACVGMNIDGHRCPHKVPLDRMAMASAALRRLEGVGILQNQPATRKSIYLSDGLPT